MPQYVADILDHLEHHSRITTRAAAALTQSPVPTTKSRLKKLQSDGLIVAHGKGRGVFYTKA